MKGLGEMVVSIPYMPDGVWVWDKLLSKKAANFDAQDKTLYPCASLIPGLSR